MIDTAVAVEELRHSPKFRARNPYPAAKPGIETSNIMADKHYSPDELAELWGVSAETIRNIFWNEPGTSR